MKTVFSQCRYMYSRANMIYQKTSLHKIELLHSLHNKFLVHLTTDCFIRVYRSFYSSPDEAYQTFRKARYI